MNDDADVVGGVGGSGPTNVTGVTGENSDVLPTGSIAMAATLSPIECRVTNVANVPFPAAVATPISLVPMPRPPLLKAE